MKLTIPAKTLAKTIAGAARIVEKRSTIPILSHVLLEAGDGLVIRSTDLDLDYRTRGAAKIDAPGGCCVPAATLAEIVRKIDDKADIRMEMDDGHLVIRAGRARFRLSALPPQDFPDAGEKEFAAQFSLPAKALATLIERTSFAISTEETRYYLNGVYLHVVDDDDGPMLRGVATDGHKLARYDLPAPDGASAMPGVIAPRKTIETIARMAKDADDAPVSVAVSQTQIRFTFGDTSLTSKLIDGTFPDYARVIPASADKRAVIDAEALAQAAARVGTILSERGRSVKFSFADGVLALSVSSPDAGEARDEIEVEWDGPPFEVGFNGAYVQTILAALAAETITMKFTDPGAPAVISPRGDAAALAVLMPMRC